MFARFALIAIPALTVATIAVSTITSAMNAPFDNYDLVLEYHGERFVIDHDMSITDCFGALPKSDPHKPISWACERGE